MRILEIRISKLQIDADQMTELSSKQTPPQIIIEPSHSWLDWQLRAIWQYRELLYFLVWRDLKVRYKQTFLGIAWVVIQPVVSMLVFTVLFGMLLNAPSEGVPYPIFVLSGLLPWQYFAGSLNRSSVSVVEQASLVTKVYFPRLIIPLSAVLSGLVDFAVSFAVLGVLMIVYSTSPTSAVLLLPFFLLLAMLTAFGFGLWFSALNVRYRDVKQLMPFIVQVWMYLTPVVYSSNLLPVRYRWILDLNPMTGVVEGFRWALVGGAPPSALFPLSVLITFLVLLTGAAFFRRTERSFADII